MALGDGSLRCECFVAIGGEADIARVPPACRCEAIDPSRSRQCRGFHSIPSRPFSLRRMRINTLALVARLPTMHGTRTYVEAGGLMSYGARRAAGYVDKILRGARPRDFRLRIRHRPKMADRVIDFCCAAYVRSWHLATVRCGANVLSLLGVKRTLRGCPRLVDVKRLTHRDRVSAEDSIRFHRGRLA